MIDWHGADSLALQKELFLLVRLVFRTRQVTSCYIIAIDIYIDIDIDIDYLYRLIRCSCSTGLCRRRRSIISELSTLEWGLIDWKANLSPSGNLQRKASSSKQPANYFQLELLFNSTLPTSNISIIRTPHRTAIRGGGSAHHALKERSWVCEGKFSSIGWLLSSATRETRL